MMGTVIESARGKTIAELEIISPSSTISWIRSRLSDGGAGKFFVLAI